MKQFFTLIDAHVHIHDNFDIENFIKAALIILRILFKSNIMQF